MRRKTKTSKLMPVKSHQEIVVKETGEIINIKPEIKNRDYNFHKIWIHPLIDLLNTIGNNPIKILAYILSKMNKTTNLIHTTQQELSNNTGISFSIVNKTIQNLRKDDFLRCKSGVYMIDPNFIYYGKTENRIITLSDYNKYPAYKNNKQEKNIIKAKEIKRTAIKRIPIVLPKSK